MGACNNSLVAQLVESRTQKPKCKGSNHGVGNKLVDLAMKKFIIEKLLCDVEVVRRTGGELGKWQKRVRGERMIRNSRGGEKSFFSY